MNHVTNKDRIQKAMRVIFLMIVDILLVNAAAILSLLIRMDFSIAVVYGENYLDHWGLYSLLFTGIAILVFIPMKLYNSLWEFAGIDELLHIAFSGIIIAVIEAALIFFNVIRLPWSFPVLHGMLTALFALLCRFSYRFIRELSRRKSNKKKQKRTMLIGAGSAGMLVLREFQTSENSLNRIVCIVDDDSVQKK